MPLDPAARSAIASARKLAEDRNGRVGSFSMVTSYFLDFDPFFWLLSPVPFPTMCPQHWSRAVSLGTLAGSLGDNGAVSPVQFQAQARSSVTSGHAVRCRVSWTLLLIPVVLQDCKPLKADQSPFYCQPIHRVLLPQEALHVSG